MIWLVRDTRHRITFCTDEMSDALRWAAHNMGYPHERFDPNAFPSCQFEFETTWVMPGDTSTDDYIQTTKYIAYVDWELGPDDEDPESFRVVVTYAHSGARVEVYDVAMVLA